MKPKQNESTKQNGKQTSTHTHKSSSTSNKTGNGRDDIILTKDKSPDDLEILD